MKSLASQTAKATEEISAQINAIQAETKQVVENIQSIRTTIMEVNEISSSIAAAVEQQGAATQEIAPSVQKAASGTNQVSQNISGVTAATTETGAKATMVLESSDRLAASCRRCRPKCRASSPGCGRLKRRSAPAAYSLAPGFDRIRSAGDFRLGWAIDFRRLDLGLDRSQALIDFAEHDLEARHFGFRIL